MTEPINQVNMKQVMPLGNIIANMAAVPPPARPSAGKVKYGTGPHDRPKIARFKLSCKRLATDEGPCANFPSYDTYNRYENKKPITMHDEEKALLKLIKYVEGPKARLKYETMGIFACFYPWYECIIANKKHNYMINVFTRNRAGIMAWKYPWKKLEYINGYLLDRPEIMRLNPHFDEKGKPINNTPVHDYILKF